MKIKRIAIQAEMEDGTVRHIFTERDNRDAILTAIQLLEGSVRISSEPVENVIMANTKDEQ